MANQIRRRSHLDALLPQTDAIVNRVGVALLDIIGIRGRDMKGNTDDRENNDERVIFGIHEHFPIHRFNVDDLENVVEDTALGNWRHGVHCKCPQCAWWQ